MKKLFVTVALLCSCALVISADAPTADIVVTDARVEYLKAKRVRLLDRIARLLLADGKADDARKLLASDVTRITADAAKGDLELDDAHLLYLAGIVEESTGNNAGRLRMFNLVRKHSPSDKRFHIQLADKFDVLHRSDIMEYELKRAIESKPRERYYEMMAVARLANAALANRQFARAAELFDRARTMAEARRKVLVSAEKLDELVEETITRYSYYHQICSGYVLLEEGKPDSWRKALEKCEQAWKLDVDRLEATVLGERIATACPDKKQADELRRQWRARSDELVKSYRMSIASAPGTSSYYNRLAWLFAELNRNHDEGIRLAMRAIELRPHEGAYIDTLAELQFKKGDIAGAIKTIRRVIDRFPYANDYYRHQLDRFEAALKSSKTNAGGAP